MQISPREKRLVTIGGIILVVILIWNFLTPASNGKSTAGQVPLKQALRDTDTNQHNLARLNREMTDLDPQIATEAYDVAPDELVPRTVRDLQQIAAKAGVHIREIKPVRPRLLPSGMGSSVPLEVHFLAPFQPNAMKFLYYIEDPAGKMVVDKLDITSADPSKKTVEISAQVSVYTRAVSGSGAADSGDKSNATSTN